MSHLPAPNHLSSLVILCSLSYVRNSFMFNTCCQDFCCALYRSSLNWRYFVDTCTSYTQLHLIIYSIIKRFVSCYITCRYPSFLQMSLTWYRVHKVIPTQHTVKMNVGMIVRGRLPTLSIRTDCEKKTRRSSLKLIKHSLMISAVCISIA